MEMEQETLPGLDDNTLQRSPEDRLRVMCVTNPIIRQLVHESLFAAVSPKHDGNVVVWTMEEARRYPEAASLFVVDEQGTRVGWIKTSRDLTHIKRELELLAECYFSDPDPEEAVGGTGNVTCPHCSGDNIRFDRVDGDGDLWFTCEDECHEDGDGNSEDYQWYLPWGPLAAENGVVVDAQLTCGNCNDVATHRRDGGWCETCDYPVYACMHCGFRQCREEVRA